MSNQKKYHLYSGTKLIGGFYVSDTLKVSLIDGLNMAEVPIDFYNGYIKGQRLFDGSNVNSFVTTRVLPSGRQNISGILKQVGIEEYDELAIFLYCKGRFTQDDFWIEEY